VENCQVGVFLSYVTALGHALIDRELYLPEDWCSDLPRKLAAHIPETVPFQTKPELAKRMVQRAQAAHLPIRWVVADTVYGHSPDLRLWLEEQGYASALAVPSTEVICVQTRAGILLSDVASIAPRHCVGGIGSASLPARAPKASASLTGLACPSCTLVPWTVETSS
jgi:DDE superfamily endonuclease